LKNIIPFLVVDAIYLKVRENGRVRSKGLLIAKAVNELGHREIIGFQMANSESETSWSDFFSYLQERGLADVDLVVSDNHKGLVKAIQKHFQGAAWQRCQTHFSKNILDKTPKRLKAEVKAHLRSIYDARDINEARRLLAETLAKFEQSAAKAMNLLEEGFEDILAVIGLPEKYRKRLRTTNSIERLNEEIRRRDRVIRIYPNEASAIRLIGALLIEHDEKWSTGRKYLDMEEYYDFLKQKKKSKNSFIA